MPRLGILATDLDEKVDAVHAAVAQALRRRRLRRGGRRRGRSRRVRVGDVIYEINNRPVKSLKDVMEACRDLKPDKAGRPPDREVGTIAIRGGRYRLGKGQTV